VAVELSVGVPVMAPVDELKESPDGSVGEMVYVRGEDPPDPITGINEVDATV
jgi:hypothetical protein